MQRLPIAIAASLALVGCMNPGAPTSPPSASKTCDADPAQHHVGHDATEAMGAAILKDSGAATLRWGPPDSAWTMDFREDRVNVRYDDDMTITEITCG